MSQKKVAFVTGAGRGIGRGIVLELARSGCDIAANDILYDATDLQTGLGEVQAEVEALKVRFLPVQADIAELEGHQRMIRTVLDEFGRIDILVNNAGVAPKERLDVLETTPESFDRVLSVNTRGTFFLTQKIAQQMCNQAQTDPKSQPCIVFISSISADVSSPSRAEYCISKAGISQMARIFAHRLAEHAINVYEVRPGIIQTDMTSAVKEKYDELIAAGLVPQKRWGFPKDVGKAVAALANGDFDYSTGLILEVSGGMNIRRL